jgi:hypothetical protein
VSDQHSAPSGSSVTRSDTGATAALKVVALLTAVCVIIATFAPLLSSGFDEGSDALADGGSDVVVYVFVGLAVLAFAAFVAKDTTVSAGLIGGVSATVVGYFFFVESAMHVVVDAFGDDVGYGAGFVFGVLAVFAAATGVVMSFRGRAHGSGASSAGGWALVGVFAAAGTTLGVMLPPNDSGQGFSERNFDFDPALLEFGWLVFVASLGVPGIVGFASRTKWGLSAAFGAWVPTTWLTLTAITGSENDFDTSTALVSFDNIHPILPVAIAVQALALVLGYRAVKQPGPANLGAVRSPVAERAGIWAPDPYRRHGVRYHDGTEWTDYVADGGIASRDRAAHPPPPGADPGGAWAGDPYGRHRQRFFDGTRWTIHVADSGGVGSTDAATYPPPAPPPPPPLALPPPPPPPPPSAPPDASGHVPLPPPA